MLKIDGEEWSGKVIVEAIGEDAEPCFDGEEAYTQAYRLYSGEPIGTRYSHRVTVRRNPISIHAPLTGCDSKHAEFSSSFLRISNKIRLSVTTLSPSLVALILLYDILPTFSSANASSFHAGLHFASHYQRPLGFVAALCAEMFNFCIIFVSKIVKAQAVSLRIHYRAQFMLKPFALCRVKQALKHRILHALTVIYALFCYFSQSFSSRYILGIHIICDEHHQSNHLISTETEDIHPNPLSGILPTEVTAHTAQVPMPSFL